MPIEQSVITDYDQSVENNPDWVDVDQAMLMIDRKDRQTRIIGNRLGWPKKYAKVDGKPKLYWLKSAIEEYSKAKMKVSPSEHIPAAEDGEEVADQNLQPPPLQTPPPMAALKEETPIPPKEPIVDTSEIPRMSSSKELTTEQLNGRLQDVETTLNEVLKELKEVKAGQTGGKVPGVAQALNKGLVVVAVSLAAIGAFLVISMHKESISLLEKNAKISEDLHSKEIELSTMKNLFEKFQQPNTTMNPTTNSQGN